jgi:hypothetical protein
VEKGNKAKEKKEEEGDLGILSAVSWAKDERTSLPVIRPLKCNRMAFRKGKRRENGKGRKRDDN